MADKIRLTKQQTQAAIDAQRKLHDLLPEVDKMERCGADCQQHRLEIKKLQDMLSAYVQNFGTTTR